MNNDLLYVIAFIRRFDRVFPRKISPIELLGKLKEKWSKDVIQHLLDIENKKPVSERIKILTEAAIVLALGGDRKLGKRKGK